jgi:putative salt-induced outer membrane protein
MPRRRLDPTRFQILEKKMKNTLLASAFLLALPLSAFADDTSPKGDWSGTGEAGLAIATGNTKSQNINAKIAFKKEDDQWKDNFYLTGVRNKASVVNATTGQKQYDTTANRFELGASAGYKLDERSYIVGAGRYEHDDFSPYRWQGVVSLGYGYTLLKTSTDELSFEVGPGYKRFNRADYTVLDNSTPPAPLIVRGGVDDEIVGRGLVHYKHQLTETTAFEDTLLAEVGADNKFYQNDAGVAVKVSSKLALKVGYQVRHNTDVVGIGVKKTDQLLTTNLVYNF